MFKIKKKYIYIYIFLNVHLRISQCIFLPYIKYLHADQQMNINGWSYLLGKIVRSKFLVPRLA